MPFYCIVMWFVVVFFPSVLFFCFLFPRVLFSSVNHCRKSVCLSLKAATRTKQQIKVIMIVIDRGHRNNLVSWCFELSQPQRVISGLKTNSG